MRRAQKWRRTPPKSKKNVVKRVCRARRTLAVLCVLTQALCEVTRILIELTSILCEVTQIMCEVIQIRTVALCAQPQIWTTLSQFRSPFAADRHFSFWIPDKSQNSRLRSPGGLDVLSGRLRVHIFRLEINITVNYLWASPLKIADSNET